MHSTTILAVRHKGQVAVAGDGQVTLNEYIVKASAKKIRRLHHDQVVVGFAGSAADSFALMERFEEKLQDAQGNVVRGSYALARDWRTDRNLRRLEAMLVRKMAKKVQGRIRSNLRPLYRALLPVTATGRLAAAVHLVPVMTITVLSAPPSHVLSAHLARAKDRRLARMKKLGIQPGTRGIYPKKMAPQTKKEVFDQARLPGQK